MKPKFLLLCACLAIIASVASADIFGDLLGWAVGGDSEEKSTASREDEEGTSTCDCEGKTCNCCVDFNLTSIIDLGGPGCVKMRYISQTEGVALNVSYGDSLLHSETVKQNNKKGSCMDLLSELAQICARFAALKQTDDGLEGCLHFEPHVLGEVTAKYHIGCFKMGNEGMVLDPKLAEAEEPEEEEKKPDKPDAESEEEEEEEDDASSILDVVNQSAQQGIAFFSDLLGIKGSKKKNKTTTEKVVEETTEGAETSEEEGDGSEETRGFHPVKSHLGRLHLTGNKV